MANSTAFFTSLREIAAALDTPGDAARSLSTLLDQLDDVDLLREFFHMLDDPRWISPLAQCHYFENPPAPEMTAGGGFRCRSWPQSKYLVRMAPLAPDQVTSVLATIRTTNWTIAHDIVEAAILLPSEFATKLIPAIKDTFSSAFLGHALVEIAHLASRLAMDGLLDQALDLVRTVFAIDPTGDSRTSRGQDYGYIEALRESVLPHLLPHAPAEILRLLMQWQLAAMRQQGDDGRSHDEHSYIWRPAIEDHEQNHDYDLASKLVSCLRDGFEKAIQLDLVGLSESLEMLEQHDVQLFNRLRIHLIAQFGDKDAVLALSTMLSPSLFADHVYKHEYARLMGMRWELLDEKQREQWLSWIDAGPASTEGHSATTDDDAETLEAQKQYWQFQRLSWIKAHLTGKWLELYERMFREHGKPILADLNTYTTVAVGDESPASVEDLSELGFDGVVQKLSTWREAKDSGLNDPTATALARTFGQFLKSAPGELSAEAGALKGLHPRYVREFIGAMRTAVEEGKDIELQPVLDLCGWVVSRPIDEQFSQSPSRGLDDPGWRWCRDTIAEFIQRVCASPDNEDEQIFGDEFDQSLADLLPRLLESPGESHLIDEDAATDPRTADWPSLSLNAPRGKATQALIRYIQWAVKLAAPERDLKTPFDNGLDLVPDAKLLLEAQLTRPDDSFTGRAIFGNDLGWLYMLDRQWLADHVSVVFNLTAYESEPSTAYGWAAWNNFLFYSGPHIRLYELLRDQYAYAVEQARTIDKPQEERERPFARLGEHLVVLFGRGDLGKSTDEALKADGAIIHRLVTESAQSIRSHAINFVGQSLMGGREDVPSDVLERFQGLWDHYWSTIGVQDAKDHPGNWTFGHWFASGVFDLTWSLERLEDFVKVDPGADPDHMILERLAEVCESDPARSARIVGMMVDGDDEGWRMPSWRGEARTILEVAMKTGGEAKTTAEQVIDRLGRRGFLEFGELLDPPVKLD